MGSNPIARSKFDLSAETTCGTTINYFTTTLGFEADPSAACGGCSEGGRLQRNEQSEWGRRNPIARSKFDLSVETTCGTTINYFTTTLGFEADPSAACGGCSEGGRLRLKFNRI